MVRFRRTLTLHLTRGRITRGYQTGTEVGFTGERGESRSERVVNLARTPYTARVSR